MRLLSRKHLAVVTAASTDETRFMLNGVLIQETKHGARTVATNGRMLAVVESRDARNENEFPHVAGFDKAPNSAQSAVIPRDAIANAIRTLPKSSRRTYGADKPHNCVAIKMSGDASTLATSDGQSSQLIPTKNIEGHYPNWEQVIPQTAEFKIKFNPALLIALLEIAEKIAGHGNSVTLEFTTPSNPIKISAEDKEGHAFIGVGMPMKD